MLNAELRVLDGKHQGKSLPLNVKKFLVGREADCQLRPNSDLVSRHHCVFTIDDFSVRLRDLGSTNGTYVNNERIAGQVVLQPGDVVSIGKLTLELVIRAPGTAGSGEGSGTDLAAEGDTFLSDSTQEVAAPAAAPGDTTMLQSTADMDAYNQQVAAFNQAAMAAAQGMPQPGMQSGMFPGFMPQYPGMGMPGQMVPGQMVPGQMVPGQMVPGQMMPGQMVPGMMPQYPGMMPQYPGMMPQYPGMMPGQMMPQMPMGYPGQMPMPAGTQTVAIPPVAPPEAGGANKSVNKVKEQPVTLPPPEETGAVEVVPQAKGGAGSPSISNAAADIIKLHMNRKPR
jgi:hypothetical protein